MLTEVLPAKEYKSTVPPTWCPGCGDFGVLNAFYKTLSELKMDFNETVVVSGIGCSSRFPFFVKTYGIHSLHGRSLPLAVGVKLARPDLDVIVTCGDGDGFSIGGGHVPHVARKNIDISWVVMDNAIYGLTKGQVSPTSKVGLTGSTTPYGCPDEPVNPVGYVLTYGASFVAQGFSGNPKQLTELMKKAIQHKGFSFVNVISPCPSFNRQDTFKAYKELLEPIPETHDTSDRIKALDLAFNANGRVRTGIFYQIEKPVYQDRLDDIKKKSKPADTPDYEAIIDTFKI